MTQRELDYQHDKGLIPDWAYYQQSDKPIWQKVQEQKDKMYQQIEQNKRNKDLEKEIVEKIENAIDISINDLFKDWH